MECNKCGNKQFYTRRENHEAKFLVCSKCNDEQPIKKESKKKAPKYYNSDENQGEQL